MKKLHLMQLVIFEYKDFCNNFHSFWRFFELIKAKEWTQNILVGSMNTKKNQNSKKTSKIATFFNSSMILHGHMQIDGLLCASNTMTVASHPGFYVYRLQKLISKDKVLMMTFNDA